MTDNIEAIAKRMKEAAESRGPTEVLGMTAADFLMLFADKDTLKKEISRLSEQLALISDSERSEALRLRSRLAEVEGERDALQMNVEELNDYAAPRAKSLTALLEKASKGFRWALSKVCTCYAGGVSGDELTRQDAILAEIEAALPQPEKARDQA